MTTSKDAISRFYHPKEGARFFHRIAKLVPAVILLATLVFSVGCGNDADPEPTMPDGPLEIIDH